MAEPLSFQNLIPELTTRSARGATSRLALANTPLREFLSGQLSADAGQRSSFLAEPVLESTFGWATASETIGSLRGQLLPSSLVDCLTSPPTERIGEDYSFPSTRHPYVHQLESWLEMAKPPPRAAVVTSGTGSGKTECFLIPILSDLARQLDTARSLEGVQAIFLYPLNALINSQKDRLRAWTDGFGGRIRFALYNGLTPDSVSAGIAREWPSEVRDRRTLRSSPPPILVTNSTMLEYMLVRSHDAPIIDKSKGKLRWIVLDEAHTYIGSQAAELALLLRRVMIAFDVSPSSVRFVATSATIGDGDAKARGRLSEFISGVAGVEAERVSVISGRRALPRMLSAAPSESADSLESLESLVRDGAVEELSRAVIGHPVGASIRNAFRGSSRHALRLSQIERIASPSGSAGDERQATLRWLDVLSTARDADDPSVPFLPMRLHLFHRTFPGLWVCPDRQCPSRRGTALDHPDWGFGSVYTEERVQCECGASVFPARRCDECGDIRLFGVYAIHADGRTRLRPAVEHVEDEFELEADIQTDELEESEDASAELVGTEKPAFIRSRPLEGETLSYLDPETLEVEFDPKPGWLQVVLRLEEDSGAGRCDQCGAAYAHRRGTFRPFILGAPFFLGQILPTALEFSPDGPEPLLAPYRGRRALAFTDSRQGSARIAAKVQQESERQRARSLVLDALYAGDADLPAKKAQCQQELQDLLKAADQFPALRAQVETKQRELDSLSRPRRVSFQELVSHLAAATDFDRWIKDYYADKDPDLGNDSHKLAEMALVREFARRPRRVNNLETMGLARIVYPKLDAVRVSPSLPELAPIQLEEWREFLRICLDFFLRENTIINLPEKWRRWGGNLLRQKRVLPPDSSDVQTAAYRTWPRATGSRALPRPARLLALGLGLDPAEAWQRDAIDELLKAAWRDIVTVGLLQADGPGFYLPMRHMSFELMHEAWVCPITRRFLGSTFRGLTPYLPRIVADRAAVSCEQVQLPICVPRGRPYGSPDGMVSAIREWLESDDQVGRLRAAGLWSDLTDRVLEGAGYFRTAEHSAQQSTARLQKYEALFRKHRLNLLSCSTTMEMGVDIGGVATVAMNNVPPHPANYLQRAGRAGRRSEPRALAITLCKHNPHDYAVFANPLWPFETATNVPSVSLENRTIVLRHANSLLLGRYLRARAEREGVDALKLTSGWFFGEGEVSPANEFITWCEAAGSLEQVAPALDVLLANTGLASTTDRGRLMFDCAAKVRVIAEEWRGRLARIDLELAEFRTAVEQRSPAFKALTRTRSRQTDEYLLRELTEEGLLPGYGFPTGLVQFDNFTKEQFAAMRDDVAREDNRARRGDFPTRDLPTALREYPPGADVVIDGVVYRSAGVTLNWHAPANVEAGIETQYFAWAWRCKACGEVGTVGSYEQNVSCTACGAVDDKIQKRLFLQPAGFAVDFYAPTHSDVSTQTYVPPEAPWIQAGGRWLPLTNPILGRYRANGAGLVFSHGSGTNGLGYAICLVCGRSEPMENGPTGPKIPRSMLGHRRLRGREKEGDRECPGGADEGMRRVKASVYLGVEERTDVMELLLYDVGGRPLADEQVAYTLAVALRKASAALLGVEPDELGCDAKPWRTASGAPAQLIVLFDQNAAGYATAAAARLDAVLQRVPVELSCPRNCERACQHCLLSYDTRFHSSDIDRKKAREFLSDQWLSELVLPDELKAFGELTRIEHNDLSTATSMELERQGARGVDIFLQGSPVDWDIAGSELRPLLYRWAARGFEVRLVVRSADANSLPEGCRLDLAALARVPGLTICSLEASADPAALSLIVRVHGAGWCTGWAATSTRVGSPAEAWGLPGDATIVRGSVTGSVTDIGPPLPTAVLAPTPGVPGALRELRISDQLNGDSRRFGERFVDLLESHDPRIGTVLADQAMRVTQIRYTDRYLRSPLTVALLTGVLDAMRKRLEGRWQVEDIQIATTRCDGTERFGDPNVVYANWPASSTRDDVLRAVIGELGESVTVQVGTNQEIPHARVLSVELASRTGGKASIISIWLDQGFGYWRARPPGRGLAPNTYFNHRGPMDRQIAEIRRMNVVLRGEDFESVIFTTIGERSGAEATT